MPPALELSEKVRTVLGDLEKWNSTKNTVVNKVEMDPDNSIRQVQDIMISY